MTVKDQTRKSELALSTLCNSQNLRVLKKEVGSFFFSLPKNGKEIPTSGVAPIFRTGVFPCWD